MKPLHIMKNSINSIINQGVTAPPHLQSNKLKNSRVLALLLISTIALTACGGGSGSVANSSPTSLESVLSNSANGAERAKSVATSIPRSGSVTQSSNAGDVSGVADTTQDQVVATAEYVNGNLMLTVTNTPDSGNSWEVSTEENVRERSTVSADDLLSSQPLKKQELGKSVTGGEVYVSAITDRQDANDTDYLVGGLWVFVPTAGTGLVIGAFMDAPDNTYTPTNYLRPNAEVTATYRGDATGLYIPYSGTEIRGAAGEFDAEVELDATFKSAAPVISGKVLNIIVDGQALDSGLELILDQANIENVAGGFFAGDVSGSESYDGSTASYEGKWGGQFYGGEAGLVGGTFAGTGVESDSGGTETGEGVIFVGTFGAEKQ